MHSIDDFFDLTQLFDVSLAVELADLGLDLVELLGLELNLLFNREHVLVLQGQGLRRQARG